MLVKLECSQSKLLYIFFLVFGCLAQTCPSLYLFPFGIDGLVFPTKPCQVHVQVQIANCC